jgi:hypothetical protein
MNYSCCLLYYCCGPYASKFFRLETIGSGSVMDLSDGRKSARTAVEPDGG